MRIHTLLLALPLLAGLTHAGDARLDEDPIAWVDREAGLFHRATDPGHRASIALRLWRAADRAEVRAACLEVAPEFAGDARLLLEDVAAAPRTLALDAPADLLALARLVAPAAGERPLAAATRQLRLDAGLDRVTAGLAHETPERVLAALCLLAPRDATSARLLTRWSRVGRPLERAVRALDDLRLPDPRRAWRVALLGRGGRQPRRACGGWVLDGRVLLDDQREGTIHGQLLSAAVFDEGGPGCARRAWRAVGGLPQPAQTVEVRCADGARFQLDPEPDAEGAVRLLDLWRLWRGGAPWAAIGLLERDSSALRSEEVLAFWLIRLAAMIEEGAVAEMGASPASALERLRSASQVARSIHVRANARRAGIDAQVRRLRARIGDRVAGLEAAMTSGPAPTVQGWEAWQELGPDERMARITAQLRDPRGATLVVTGAPTPALGTMDAQVRELGEVALPALIELLGEGWPVVTSGGREPVPVAVMAASWIQAITGVDLAHGVCRMARGCDLHSAADRRAVQERAQAWWHTWRSRGLVAWHLDAIARAGRDPRADRLRWQRVSWLVEQRSGAEALRAIYLASSGDARRQFLRQLGRPHGPARDEDLQADADGADPELSALALAALLDRGAPDAVARAVSLLRASRGASQATSAVCSRLAARDVEALASLLDAPTPVAVAAATALLETNDRRGADRIVADLRSGAIAGVQAPLLVSRLAARAPDLVASLLDGPPLVACAAAHALAGRGDPSGPERLAALVIGGQVPREQVDRAIETIAWRGPGHLPRLAANVDGPAARSLSRLLTRGAASAQATLALAVLADRHPTVRQAATSTLLRWQAAAERGRAGRADARRGDEEARRAALVAALSDPAVRGLVDAAVAPAVARLAVDLGLPACEQLERAGLRLRDALTTTLAVEGAARDEAAARLDRLGPAGWSWVRAGLEGHPAALAARRWLEARARTVVRVDADLSLPRAVRADLPLETPRADELAALLERWAQDGSLRALDLQVEATGAGLVVRVLAARPDGDPTPPSTADEPRAQPAWTLALDLDLPGRALETADAAGAEALLASGLGGLDEALREAPDAVVRLTARARR